MTEFLLVRHGEPDYEAIKDFARIDVAKNFAPLTEAGVRQIYKSIELLKKEKADIIISSPYTRALQGAGIMARELELEMRVEPMLYEWQLDATQSVRNRFLIKRLVRQFNRKKWNSHCKWESSESVKERVLKVFDKYSEYDKVIVSCHAMMMGYTTGDMRAYEYGEIKRFVPTPDSGAVDRTED